MEALIVSGRNLWLQVLCKPGILGEVGRGGIVYVIAIIV